MGTPKRKRKWIRGTLALLLLLLLAMPLWLPWVLRPGAAFNGAHYSKYERHGYSSFAVGHVTFTNRYVRLQIERMEGLVPTVWLWRLWTHPKQSETNQILFARASNWNFETIPQPQAKGGTNNTATSTYEVSQEVTRTLHTVAKWIPSAAVTNGHITVEKFKLEIPDAIWMAGGVSAHVRFPQWPQSGSIAAELLRAKPYNLRLHSEALHLKSEMQIIADSAAITVQSASQWWSNQVDLRAEFRHSGALPEQAFLQATNFQFPAQLLQLPAYENVRGSLYARWEAGHFLINLNSSAAPVSGETNLPPFKLNLQARGDTNAILVESAVVTAPWLRAELSKSAAVYFNGELLREPVAVHLDADLTKQPWVSLQGNLSGQAQFTPASGKFPSATFQLSGSRIGTEKIKSRTLAVAGRFEWPELDIRSAECSFEDDSTVSISGRVDLKNKVCADANVRFAGPLAGQFLPPDYGYQSLVLTGNLHGPFTQLVHQVHVEASQLTIPNLQPLSVEADWIGQDLDLQRAQLKVSAGSSELRAEFSAHLPRDAFFNTATNQSGPTNRRAISSVGTVTLQLNHLSFLTNGNPVLGLQTPAQFTFSRGPADTNWSASIDALHLTGPAGELQAQLNLEWPATGNGEIAIQRASSDVFNDFLKSHLERVQIQRFTAAAEWTNGPANFSVELSAAESLPKALPFTLNLSMAGDRDGIILSNLVVSNQTSVVAIARGSLPLTINPGAGTNALDFLLHKPLQLTARTEPHAFFWSQFAQWTGLALRDPDLNVNLSGTWESPKGTIRLNSPQIQFIKANRRFPALDDFALEMELDQQEARLTDCQLLVQGQTVTLTGEIPLGTSFWTGLKSKRIPDWQKATARLRIQNAQIAAFADLLPTLLAPQGEVDVDLSLTPGGNLAGGLVLSGARTRPLSGLGPIRDIQARLNFSEHGLTLQNTTATIGGESITLSGQADLRPEQWLQAGLPPFELKLSGTNVPLSRQLESIIRSDLDLTLTKTNAAPPRISGVTRLRNSYFLSDLADLVPGKVEAPSQRPPYFSIEDPFLADWRLDVKVTGPRCLQVRSSLFHGEISANLRIQGTLKEPIALGDVKIDSGIVRFPFANLEVRQGFVSLTSQNPYRPELSVTAGSKQYGYEIKMDLTGPADAPVIQFTSTPPLGSEQILLMVTAGQLPKGEYTLTPQQRAQTVGLFLGRDLLSRLGVGESTEQRLTVRTGEEMTEQGKPTYGVEYKLTGRWSLQGEYDRFGEFNAGVKWRLFSR